MSEVVLYRLFLLESATPALSLIRADMIVVSLPYSHYPTQRLSALTTCVADRRLSDYPWSMSTDAENPFLLADQAAAAIREHSGIPRYDIALVLGSGWGGAAELIGDLIDEIPAEDVPGFSAPAVKGHGTSLRTLRIHGSDKIALVLGSRTHYYEGKGTRAVAHGMRTAASLGCSTVVLTNGCGGLNPHWKPGQPVLIRDHINLTAATPLEGANFVDLTDLYSQRLRDLAHTVDESLPEGVYVQFPGPQYETPAEVRMAKIIGGDLVGMSTTLEAIAAREAGMEILGISLMTNLGAGISPVPLSHAEVLEAGQAAAPRISRLLADIVQKI